MIRNIVFDIGNVIVDFQPATYFKDHFSDEKRLENVCNAIFHSPEWVSADEGTLDYASIRDIFHEMYPDMIDDIDYVMDHWMNMMTLKKETLDFASKLKEDGFGIYLLSNISYDSLACLEEKYHFCDMFDGAVFSYEERLVKPDPEIYRQLLMKYSLRSDECIYIDDMEVNVLQASALGMNAIQYINDAQMKEDVEEIIKEEL